MINTMTAATTPINAFFRFSSGVVKDRPRRRVSPIVRMTSILDQLVAPSCDIVPLHFSTLKRRAWRADCFVTGYHHDSVLER